LVRETGAREMIFQNIDAPGTLIVAEQPLIIKQPSDVYPQIKRGCLKFLKQPLNFPVFCFSR
jgi:hypothetical protein